MHSLRKILTVIVFASAVSPAMADDHLIVYFHQRPPYSWLDDSSNVSGVVAEPADRALRKAGIPFTWAALPSARQMETIKRNDSIACGLGWFKRPEREEFARFSAPIYHDRRMVIIARRADDRFLGEPTVETLFLDSRLTLLTKVGYSYGGVMDERIATLNPRREATATDNLHMLDMIALNRADFMLMSAEEADYLLREENATAKALAPYPFAEAPDGEARYLMCSQLVPQALLDRFNAALAAPQ